jgi:hypothetical protein
MRAPHVDTDVFIVRIWREAIERDDAPPPWRGQVEHLASQRRLGFTSLHALCRFIAKTARLERPPAPDDGGPQVSPAPRLKAQRTRQ